MSAPAALRPAIRLLPARPPAPSLPGHNHRLPTLQGETLDGHDVDLLRVGEDGPDKKKIWIVARQHPGESMAGA